MFNSLTIPTVFNGNGVATTGTYGFPTREKTDVRLVKVDSNGVIYPMSVDTDFTLNGIADPNSSNWTFETIGTPLASGWSIYAYPAIPFNQLDKLSQQSGTLAETIESMCDRIVVRQAQQQYDLDRAIKVQVGAAYADPDVFVTQLQAAVLAAATSATNAATSESNALTSKNAAAASATAAAASATSAAAMLAASNNFLINGNMDIWQRGTSFTPTAGTILACYTADRWCALRQSAVAGLTVSRITTSGVVGALYEAKIQRTAGDTSTNVIDFGQMLSAETTQGLWGQNVIVDFWVRKGADFSGNAINAIVSYGNGSTTNTILDGTGWTEITRLAVTDATSSMVKYTLTATIPSTAKNVAVRFSYTPTGTAGANDWFAVTRASMRLATSAIPFIPRPYELEYDLCRWYYEKLSRAASIPFRVMAQAISTTHAIVAIGYAKKRAIPTLNLSAASTFALNVSGTFNACSGSIASNSILDDMAYLDFTNSGLTANNGYHLGGASGQTASMEVIAEL